MATNNLINILSDDDDTNSLFSNTITCEYTSEKDCRSFFSANKGYNFTILHFNARSLNSSFDKIKCLLSSAQIRPTVIAITETWLTDSTANTYFLPDYNFVYNNRTSSGGGGVGIFINDTFDFSVCHDLNRMLPHIECLYIEINRPDKHNILIGCIYRPSNPKSNAAIEQFNLDLNETLDTLVTRKTKSIILGGDFNLDLLNYGNHAATSDFMNNLLSHSFVPTITVPTRITNHSSTLLVLRSRLCGRLVP